MKKLLTLSIAMSALFFTASAQVQRGQGEGKKKMHESHQKGGMHNKDGMKDLNLTDAQKQQMKASREELKLKMEALKNQSLTPDEMKDKRKSLMTEYKAKMETILTPEQKAKMAEHRKDFKGKKGDKMGKGDLKRKGMKGRSAEMKSQLGLTAAQEARMKEHQQAMKVKREAIKNNTSLTDEAKKQQLEQLRKESKETRKSILTADQIKKMEEMKKNRKQSMGKKSVKK